MGWAGNIMNAAGAALYAFRESMLNADPQGRRASLDFGTWDRWEARLTRYDLLWSMYQNNSFRDLVHPWAARYKTAYGVYKHARHLYNPAYRLGEFWAGHLMGGALDPKAGDGESAPSCLPILTEIEDLRPAIARLWKDSGWQRKKDLYTRWGAVLADVALKVVDDRRKGRVRLRVVHPGHLKWVDKDDEDNVKAYVLQRWMWDPRGADIENLPPMVDPLARMRPVLQIEKCFRDGDDVVFQQFLNTERYDWDRIATGEDPARPGNQTGERVEKYGFVPMVLAHHEDVGMDWGACCFHAGLERFREVDTLGSGLGDQIAKAIRAPMLLSGVAAPGKGGRLRSAQTDRATQPADAVANDPEPERTQLDLLYAPEKATATHMTFDLDIAGVIAHVAMLNQDIEKNFPEVLADVGLGGQVTAEAIRNARQLGTSKAQAKRPAYDGPLAAAQKMALTIGGFKGYEGYGGFDLDSYAAGRLDHAIGARPVFEVDPRDSIEEDLAFWQAIQAQTVAGVPLPLALERNGWSEEDLAALAKAKAAEPPPVVVAPGGIGGKGPGQAPTTKGGEA